MSSSAATNESSTAEAVQVAPEILRFQEGYQWEGLPVLVYKPDGNHFKDITRQVLFEGDPILPCQWRYFEIAPGGHSTLEYHHHYHVVMIVRGRGHVFMGDTISEAGCFDVLKIPSFTWHQFRATGSEPFGFLCLVNVDRDRPKLPQAEDLEKLRAIPGVGDFIRC